MCPRECGIDRTKARGYCGAGSKIRVARAALHRWEEPCISGTNGSGTVFFSHCSLQCCFCQNYQISAEGFGKEISVERLAEIFLELQEKGAHNINLVNPTHYAAWIIRALEMARPYLQIPVVYNSGGYERIQTLQGLNGFIDIYLPDLKYRDIHLSKTYSSAGNYFEKASAAILEMAGQVGKPKLDETGMLRRGLLVRHMILPGSYRDSIAVFDWLRANFEPDELLVSLMSQYTPCYQSAEYPAINRRLTSFEYQKVADKVIELGFCGYLQQREAARTQYIPRFDLEGV